MISYDEVYEHLRCGVCCESHNGILRSTPCGHIFCEVCIERFCTESTVKCPLCKQQFRITRKTGLVKAFIIGGLLEAMEKKRSTFCQYEDHGLPYSLHCITCQRDDVTVPICSRCLAADHLGHIVVPSDASADVRLRVRQSSNACEPHPAPIKEEPSVINSNDNVETPHVEEFEFTSPAGILPPELESATLKVESETCDVDITESSYTTSELCSDTLTDLTIDEVPVEVYYVAMLQYRRQHNSYDVPLSYKCALAGYEFNLGSWLSMQSTLYQRSSLPLSRYNIFHALALEKLLPWPLNTTYKPPEPLTKRQRSNDETDDKFECLMKYALSAGHLNIPQGYMAQLNNNNKRFSLHMYFTTNMEKLRSGVSFSNSQKFQLFIDAGVITADRRISEQPVMSTGVNSTIAVDNSPDIDITEPPITRGTVVLFKYWFSGRIYCGIGLVLRWYNMSTVEELDEIFYRVRQYFLPELEGSVGPVDIIRDIPKQSVLLRKVEMLGEVLSAKAIRMIREVQDTNKLHWQKNKELLLLG